MGQGDDIQETTACWSPLSHGRRSPSRASDRCERSAYDAFQLRPVPWHQVVEPTGGSVFHPHENVREVHPRVHTVHLATGSGVLTRC